jgi:hypothetical protein
MKSGTGVFERIPDFLDLCGFRLWKLEKFAATLYPKALSELPSLSISGLAASAPCVLPLDLFNG